jgi:hypothetical protein
MGAVRGWYSWFPVLRTIFLWESVQRERRVGCRWVIYYDLSINVFGYLERQYEV